jgi:hypothetical protein
MVIYAAHLLQMGCASRAHDGTRCLLVVVVDVLSSVVVAL